MSPAAARSTVARVDPAAQALASDVYRRLTHDGTAPPDTAHAAACLHHAVRELRKRGPLPPTPHSAKQHTTPPPETL